MQKQIREIALLGTEKRSFDISSLPKEIAQSMEGKEYEDSETQFLMAASLSYFYMHSGLIDSKMKVSPDAPVISEKLEIAPNKVNQIFSHIALLDHSVKELLCGIWMDLLIEKNYVVGPDMIVGLLKLGEQFSKKNKDKVMTVIGKKGKWILSLYDDHGYGAVPDRQDLWLEGTLDQRKRLFTSLYRNPEYRPNAINLLKDTWKAESITTKKAFLIIISQSPYESDIPFIEELYNNDFAHKEKERKTDKECRKITASILMRFESTSLHRKVTEELLKCIRLHSKKSLLGLRSSERIMFDFEVNSSFWSSDYMHQTFGFETQQYNTHVFQNIQEEWLSEFITTIPIKFWAKRFTKGYKGLVEYFIKDKSFEVRTGGRPFSRFSAALISNAIHHHDTELAALIVDYLAINEVIPLLKVLSRDQYEDYVIKKEFTAYTEVLENSPLEDGDTWSLTFSRQVVKSIYESLTQSGYFAFGSIGRLAARFIHPKIEDTLNMYSEKLINTSNDNSWKKNFYYPIMQSIEIRKLINAHK